MLVLVLYSNLNGSDVGDGCVVGQWLDHREKKWYAGFGFVIVGFHDEPNEAMFAPSQLCHNFLNDTGDFSSICLISG